ncbi:hypothetical protein BLS_000821 [Venturia inaequalis]|uniref:Uncharacterized protein n=1 Tax=Venturia inaequalis TaxID=5025 RepID=A0A8H3Z644_VENIN|nr:hypothetical protein BLS_000821 [Venturia inaequalis]KAE9987445.1 hypothetical protein EG328_002801 [Venturia inaequalis]RDI87007.1 hypothetical protein Vi05172_g3202 [Venturia inaequalis]
MARLGKHNRNHSFPPCLQFIQRPSSKTLSPPRPDINDAPWAHFLSEVDDDDDPSDFLDYTAGIIATSDASSKKKSTKFRPSDSKKWDKQVVNFHHGTYQRREEEHGFVENRNDPWSHIVEHDVMAASSPIDISRQARPRVRSRTRSGHRHSWREPSVDIFTVEEEAVSDTYLSDEDIPERGPAILINDYSNVTPHIKFFDDDEEMFTSPRRPARDSMFSNDGIFTEIKSVHPTHDTPSLRLSPTILFDDDSLPEFVLEGSYFDEIERARL